MSSEAPSAAFCEKCRSHWPGCRLLTPSVRSARHAAQCGRDHTSVSRINNGVVILQPTRVRALRPHSHRRYLPFDARLPRLLLLPLHTATGTRDCPRTQPTNIEGCDQLFHHPLSCRDSRRDRTSSRPTYRAAAHRSRQGVIAVRAHGRPLLPRSRPTASMQVCTNQRPPAAVLRVWTHNAITGNHTSPWRSTRTSSCSWTSSALPQWTFAAHARCRCVSSYEDVLLNKCLCNYTWHWDRLPASSSFSRRGNWK